MPEATPAVPEAPPSVAEAAAAAQPTNPPTVEATIPAGGATPAVPRAVETGVDAVQTAAAGTLAA